MLQIKADLYHLPSQLPQSAKFAPCCLWQFARNVSGAAGVSGVLQTIFCSGLRYWLAELWRGGVLTLSFGSGWLIVDVSK